MPARRFWAMDRQIERIRAENDLRELQMKSLATPPKTNEARQSIEDYIGRLTLEIGEKLVVRRNIHVAPDSDTKDKFARLTGA